MTNAERQVFQVAPVLLVRDVLTSARYYQEALGFDPVGFWGDPPRFSIVQRDGCSLMLNQVGPDDQFRPNSDYDGRFDVYCTVRDADAVFADVKARGADIVCEPSDEVFGMREFSVRDPDGRLVAFGQDLSARAVAADPQPA